ncbi:MAG: PspC domain-containing protein [Rubricoccaceae bacterium]|nr:PspC domain-containing protein [Rubricoccaceae bacterium]
MATRQRTQQQQSDTHEQLDDEFSYESLYGLDDDITEEDIELFLEEQAAEEERKEKKKGFWNLQTGSGLAIIAIGAVYLLQQLNFFPLGYSLDMLVTMLPWLAGILIILTGFGVLSWSPSRLKRRARRKARERRIRRQKERRWREERQSKTVGRAESRSAAYEKAKRAARRASRETSRARTSSSQRSERKSRRLAKSKKDKKLFGVAAGIARFLGVDATLVRIALVIGTVLGNGFTIPLYIILALVLPTLDEDEEEEDRMIRVLYDDKDVFDES